MKLERDMAAFCLDETKKVNKSQMAVITGKFREMHSIVGDLRLRNARLEGHLRELQGKKIGSESVSEGMVGDSAIGSKPSTAPKKKHKKAETVAGPRRCRALPDIR